MGVWCESEVCGSGMLDGLYGDGGRDVVTMEW